MKRNEFLWGGLLVGAGVLLLLQNFGLFGSAESMIWMLLFAAASAGFLGLFVTNPSQWWPLIPGFVFFGLAAIIGLQAIAPGLAAQWSGPLFLGSLSLGFWLIYITHPKLWWAIIPGGVLSTLAVVAGIGQTFPAYGGSTLFFGLAATFGLVYLLPTPPNHMDWALIPAGICTVLGSLTLTTSTTILNYTWPIALILVGLYMMYRTFGGRPAASGADEPAQRETRKEDRYDEPTLPQPH